MRSNTHKEGYRKSNGSRRAKQTRRRASRVSKIVPHLFASARPSLQMVIRKKISTVIDLTSDGEPRRTREAYKENQIKYIHSPIRNGSPPTCHQMNQLEREIRNCIGRGDCLAHCCAGHGRTGTVIAAYLTSVGRVKDGDSAIRYVRSKRRKSVETDSQERFVRQYA